MAKIINLNELKKLNKLDATWLQTSREQLQQDVATYNEWITTPEGTLAILSDSPDAVSPNQKNITGSDIIESMTKTGT